MRKVVVTLAAGLVASLFAVAVPVVTASATPSLLVPTSFSSIHANGPLDLSVGVGGDVCVTDWSSSVWGISPNGVTTQAIYDPQHFSSGYGAWGNAMGPDGNLYVSDASSGNIYSIDQAGNVSLFAHVPDNAEGIAWSPNGDLYASSEGAIYQITPSGQVTQLSFPEGWGPQFSAELAFDAAGHLYLVEYGDGTSLVEYSVNPTTSAASYVWNSHYYNFGDYGTGVVIGSSGNVYVTDLVESEGFYGQLWAVNRTSGLATLLYEQPGDELHGPAFTPTGTLLVNDWNSGQILGFNGLETGQGGYLFHSYDCNAVQPSTVVNLKVTRYQKTVTATWLPEPGSWFLCTLLAGGGLTATSVTIRVANPTCTFTGLNAGGYYGVRVQAQNTAGVSPFAQAAAPPPVAVHYTCVKGNKVKHLTGYALVCPYGWHVL